MRRFLSGVAIGAIMSFSVGATLGAQWPQSQTTVITCFGRTSPPMHAPRDWGELVLNVEVQCKLPAKYQPYQAKDDAYWVFLERRVNKLQERIERLEKGTP